jgi:hypothetical protein
MCEITAEYFTRCTLRQPQDDDLERSNCNKAGQRGHTWCGWNHTLDLPRYMVGDSTDESLRVVPKGESK